MKILFTIALAVIVSMLALLNSQSKALASPKQEKKILIAYFSRTGNTRQIAQQILEQAGGDLFEIKVVDPYPEDYKTCTDRAKQEQQENARPQLSTKIENIHSYDTIFICYPLWWGTIPMPLFTFLESYDLSGKTIIPLCTHGGSGLARSVNDITQLCPNSTVLEGLAIRGTDVNNSQNRIAQWLRGLGITD